MLSLNKNIFMEYEVVNENDSNLSVIFIESVLADFVQFCIYRNERCGISFPASEVYHWQWDILSKEITVEDILSIHPALGELLIKNVDIIEMHRERFWGKRTITIEMELFREHIFSKMERAE